MSNTVKAVPSAVEHRVEQVRSLARRVASFDKAAKALIDLFVPEGSVVAIKRGGAAGLRWRRMHAYSHRIWMGVYLMTCRPESLEPTHGGPRRYPARTRFAFSVSIPICSPATA